MDWNILMNELVITLVPILLTLLGYTLIAVAKNVSSRTENIIVKGAIDNLERIVANTVVSLNQTIVDEMKEMNRAGKLTKEDAKRIKEKAKELIRQQITEKDRKLLLDSCCSTETLLDTMIEEKVAEAKMRKGDF